MERQLVKQQELGGATALSSCDDYGRTDLTACAATNQKMFYVGDPNPDVSFGTASDAAKATKSSTDFACGNFYLGRLVALAAVFATAQFLM